MSSAEEKVAETTYLLIDAYKHIGKAHKILSSTDYMTGKVLLDFDKILYYLEECMNKNKIGNYHAN